MGNRMCFIKYTLIFSFVAFFLIGFLGLGHMSMDMESDMNGSVTCFMPGMTEVLCQMNPIEHLAAWQSMFAVIPSQGDVLLFLIALLAIIVGAIMIIYRSSAPPEIYTPQSQFLYSKRYIPIIDWLQEIFSNGILHPKIF